MGSDFGGGMSQVNVTINGRQFRMACEDGEEEHLARLAEDLDARISRLRLRFGEIGDTRLTVMAALTLADELAEAREKLKRVEPEIAAMQEVGTQSAERSKATQAAVSAALNSAAERIERMTRRLNETVRDSGVAMGNAYSVSTRHDSRLREVEALRAIRAAHRDAAAPSPLRGRVRRQRAQLSAQKSGIGGASGARRPSHYIAPGGAVRCDGIHTPGALRS